MTAYIFDLGGVLIKLNVHRCLQAFEALMGEQNVRAVLGMDRNGEGVQSVSIATKQLMADFERGNISTEAFIEGVLAYCHPGVTKEQVVEAWMSMLDELPAERLAFVDSLRAAGHSVYLLSNGNDLHFNWINAIYRLDAHFDHLFLSQRMHLAKPESAIYKAADEAINGFGNTGKKIFIDDIEINRKAAERHVGWQTFSGISELQQ